MGHYTLECHSWWKGKLMLKAKDFRTNTYLSVSVDDAKVGCPHQLATYITKKQLKGTHA